jgi:hypothetical protein
MPGKPTRQDYVCALSFLAVSSAAPWSEVEASCSGATVAPTT